MARRPASKSTSPRSPQGRTNNAANRLLAALPEREFLALAPSLEIVPLVLKDLLHKPSERIEDVYFPGGGFCSVLTVLADGSMVEVATIGNEGVVGAGGVLADVRIPSMTMVQAATDTCYRVRATTFRQHMDRRGAFCEIVTRYSQAYLGLVMQSTACNAVHRLEQRLARWLLMAQDRIGTNPFPLTQEFVAMMLGAARPTVTIVAGTLQKAGLITYRRGFVTVVDRTGLERASCECYRVVKDLLGDVIQPTPSASRAQKRR
jgi:CRP-like cAMP-binding protein